MKKINIIFILLLFCLYASAQQKDTLLRPIGIIAGLNYNELRYTDKHTAIDGNNFSFHAGMFYRKGLGRSCRIQPTLLFSQRGGKIHDVDSTINTKLSNIELSVNFLYTRGTAFMFGAGPYFSYGITGTMESRGHKRNAYDEEESFERTLKPFEAGIGLIVCDDLTKNFYAGLSYSIGLINIYKGDGSAPNNVKAHTNTVNVSLGYLF